jgi:hypothetical protein
MFHIPAHKNTKSPAAQVPQHYDLGFAPFDTAALQKASAVFHVPPHKQPDGGIVRLNRLFATL